MTQKKQYGVKCEIIEEGRYRFHLADKSFLDIYPSMYIRRTKICDTENYPYWFEGQQQQSVLRYGNMCKSEQEQLEYALFYIDKYKAKYALKNNK